MALPIAAVAGTAAKTATTVAKVATQVTTRIAATAGRGAATAAQSGAKGFSTTVARGKVAAGRTMARSARRAIFRQAASTMSRPVGRPTVVQKRLPTRSTARRAQDQGRLRMLGILARQGKDLFAPRARSHQPLGARPSVKTAIHDMPSPQLQRFSRAMEQSRTEKTQAQTDDLQKLVRETLSRRGEKMTYITVNNGGTVNNGPNETRSNEAQKPQPQQKQRPPRARTDLTRSMVQVLRQISPHDR